MRLSSPISILYFSYFSKYYYRALRSISSRTAHNNERKIDSVCDQNQTFFRE